jgi:hypothetical protein
MRLLDAIIKNWPLEGDASGEAEKRVINCRQNFETEYVINTIIKLHPHIDRELIINAMRVCCKEIAEPYYPRPFLICLLRRLGLS